MKRTCTIDEVGDDHVRRVVCPKETAEPERSAPVRRNDVVVHELDGEAIVYDHGCGAVHRLNTVTFFVWNACDGSHGTADIAEDVAARYAIDTEQALAHVEQVIAELRSRGLLQYERDRNPRAGAVSVGAMSASLSGHALAAVQYPGRTDDRPQTPAPCNGQHEHAHASVSMARARRMSRREMLSGGATKLVFVAPVISTFFAAGAQAQMTNASGPDGCKNIGYSCAVKDDCCNVSNKQDCKNGICCVKENGPCSIDADCCPNHFCSGGICVD